MKRILFVFLLLLHITSVVAQDGVMCITKPCIVDYRTELVSGKMKRLKYIRITTLSVEENQGKYDIIYQLDYLNKKKQIQKATNITNGLQTSFTINEEGGYYLQDILYGVGKDLARNGFKLRIPKELKVGDTVEGGHCYGSFKFLGNSKFNLNYNDFKVTAEEDIETPVGTYHCFKIEGNISGIINTIHIDEQHYIWIAPNIGVVKMEYIISPKNYTSLIIDSISDIK